MHRITSQRQAQEIARAYATLPTGLATRLEHVEFLTGDPVWAGLHRHQQTQDHRSYRSTAHCVYGYQQAALPRDRRTTTIVLPRLAMAWVVVHELGHALHETIRFDHDAAPVTRYGQTNRWEAFAEAFCAWLVPDYRGVRDYLMRDEATLALFRSLAELS